MHRRFCTPSRTPSLQSDDDEEYTTSDEESESEDEPVVSPRVHPQTTRVSKSDEHGGGWWNWQRATTNAVLMYAALIIVHYAGANLYSRMCTSQTLHGLFMSPFLVPAPHCEGLRWIVYHGAARINGITDCP